MTARSLLEAPPYGTDVLVSAPGRANLIGEYTDLNDGYVLPVALDLRTVLAGRRTTGSLVVRSLDLPADGTVEVDLRTGSGPTRGWGRYATAVVQVLLEEGLALQGFEGVLSSDVPLGAGLSSSAALEVALALALLAEPLDPVRLARLCQRAENVGVGVQSGIMDQLTSAAARSGCALLLDCRDLSIEHVPLPAELSVLVVDSGVSRSLSSSAYNERKEQCGQAARALGVGSLRDATLDQLLVRWEDLDDVVRRRAHHVLTENVRVLQTAAALRDGQTELVGSLMAASHQSLANDFEVSTPELDLLVTLATRLPGVIGSRLTGAGFGGCTVSLVETSRAAAVREELCEQYAAASGRTPRGWVSEASSGAARA